MKKLILLFLLVLTSISYAQQDALVYFIDKENVEAAIANPITILTQEAIDRKQLQNTPIDERDVPVNETYISQIKNTPGISVHAKSKWMNAVYVRGSQTTIDNLTNLPFVESVEYMDKSLNFSTPATRITNKFDFYNTQERIVYNYGDATNQVEMLAVDYLHEQDFAGDEMIIAVMDSGFPNVTTNPAFAAINSEGRLLGTYDFAERQNNVDGTGSHGARTYSDIGGLLDGDFVGTAPQASFYLFRTEFAPTENPVEEAWWVEALERADSLGVDVVNTSLGYQDYDNPNYDHSYEDLDGQTTIGARGANHAFDKGMLLVTSAGNDGGGFTFVGTPGDSPGMLTVGAVDSDGNYASFSSIGPTVDGRVKPDVMAKGASAAVVDQDGNVTTSSGTSFSSPIMAGAIASLWQSRQEATNAQIMQIVREASHLYENPTDQMGYGIPNFQEAYNNLQTLGINEVALQNNFALFPNPIDTFVNISFPKHTNQAIFTIHNVIGKKIIDTKISRNNNQIDTSNLPSGVYIATVKTETTTNSFKLIKR